MNALFEHGLIEQIERKCRRIASDPDYFFIPELRIQDDKDGVLWKKHSKKRAGFLKRSLAFRDKYRNLRRSFLALQTFSSRLIPFPRALQCYSG